jgi:MerR family transcriptional regulator/heat shock protein HspR
VKNRQLLSGEDTVGMKKEYWSIREVVEIFDVDEGFLRELEEEEIVCPSCLEDPSEKVFYLGEMEKLRLAKVLSEDMGVNLPGVEVVLRMRETIFEMRKQFDEILEDMARHMEEVIKRNP